MEKTRRHHPGPPGSRTHASLPCLCGCLRGGRTNCQSQSNTRSQPWTFRSFARRQISSPERFRRAWLRRAMLWLRHACPGQGVPRAVAATRNRLRVPGKRSPKKAAGRPISACDLHNGNAGICLPVFFFAHGLQGFKRSILQFAGLNPVRITYYGRVATADTTNRKPASVLSLKFLCIYGGP